MDRKPHKLNRQTKSNRKSNFLLSALIIVIILLAACGGGNDTSNPTSTPTPTPTFTLTSTSTPMPTPTVTLTPTSTPAPTPTVTLTSIPCTAPTIEFTYVPTYGSFDNLQGRAACIDDPTDYNVAVYIKVEGGWWTKPYWDNSLTFIQEDGTWETDITTGGVDEEATQIAAYLVPAGFSPPLGKGGPLPGELREVAVDHITIERDTLGAFRAIEFSGHT